MKNLLAIACAFGLFSGAVAAPKKVVMIAGKQSHGLLSHEHNAGIQLLAKCLKEGASKLITPVVQLNGWPSDESIFEGAEETLAIRVVGKALVDRAKDTALR